MVGKGIESKNYIVSVNNKNNFKYILKIYSKSKIEDVKYEREVLNKLNANFKKKFFPIVQKGIFYINQKPSILLKYIHGRILSKRDITSCLIKKIAKKQAEMHHILANFDPIYKKNRFSIFDFSFVNIYSNDRNSNYSILQNEVNALKKESRLFLKVNFSKSIIHEDLTTENIILSINGDVNFIDFGESHRAEMISDIATAIKEIIISNKGVDFDLMRDYINSYQKITRLGKAEVNALPFLLKRRTVFMAIYLLNKQEINDSVGLKRKIEKEMKVLKILQKNNYFIEKFIKEYEYE